MTTPGRFNPKIPHTRGSAVGRLQQGPVLPFALFLDRINDLNLAQNIFKHLNSPIIKSKLGLIKSLATSNEDRFGLLWSLVQLNFSRSKMIEVVTGAKLVKRKVCSLDEVERSLSGSPDEKIASKIYILNKLGDGYISEVRPHLNSPYNKVREAAMVYYANHAMPKSAPSAKTVVDLSTISTQLSDPSKLVQRKAMRSVVIYGGVDNIVDIRPQLKSNDWLIRREAVRFVTTHGGVENRDDIKPLLKDSDTEVVLEAVKFFVEHGWVGNGAEVEPLLESPDKSIQIAAKDLLATHFGFCSHFKNYFSYESFKDELVINDNKVCREAWQAYNKHADPKDYKKLEALLNHDNKLARAYAAQAYAEVVLKQQGVLPKLPATAKAYLLMKLIAPIEDAEVNYRYGLDIGIDDRLGDGWCDKAEPCYKKAFRHGKYRVINGGFVLKMLEANTSLYMGQDSTLPFGVICTTDVEKIDQLKQAPGRNVEANEIAWEIMRMSTANADELFAIALDMQQ